MQSIQRTYNLTGSVIMPDTLNYEYIVKSEDGQETNLIDILNSIYYSPIVTSYCPIVSVEIEMNGRYKFKEEGYLELIKDSDGLFVFNVNGVSLDWKLWKNCNTGKELNINITHYLEEETKN